MGNGLEASILEEPRSGSRETFLAAVPLLGVFAMVVVAYLAGMRMNLAAPVSNIILLVSALIAAIACLRRAFLGSHRAAWVAFGLAGIAAAASHVAWTVGVTGITPSYLLLLSSISFTVGAAAVLNLRQHVSRTELSLDTALVIGAATVAVLRWAPAAHDALMAGIHTLPLSHVNVFLAPIAAIASLFFAIIAIAELSAPWTFAIGAAALSFAVATLPLALRGLECCRSGNPLALAATAGWLFVTFAALSRTAQAQPEVRADGWRIRHSISPAVALLIGATVVDSALRPPLHGITALAIGSLAMIMAVQLTELFYASRSHGADRLELDESRKLIEISNTLTGATDLAETQALVTGLANRLLHCRSTAILMLIDGGQSMELAAASGFSSSVLRMRFPLEGSFTAEVIASGKPRSTANSAAEPYLTPESWPPGEARLAVAPLLCRGDTIGALSCVADHSFSETDLELLGALADQAALAIENALLFEQVHALSLTDPLTGLANRRQLERDLGREFAAARRGRKLVAVMFDLNSFKAYNDRHGHLAGDQALQAFGSVLTTLTRAMNLAARYGGDEFVVLLADNDFFGAQIFIQRVRQFFSEVSAELGFGPITFSAGLAEYDPEMLNPAHLLAAADRALYESKRGRVST